MPSRASESTQARWSLITWTSQIVFKTWTKNLKPGSGSHLVNFFFLERKCALSWNWWRQHQSTGIYARLHGFLFCQLIIMNWMWESTPSRTVSQALIPWLFGCRTQAEKIWGKETWKPNLKSTDESRNWPWPSLVWLGSHVWLGYHDCTWYHTWTIRVTNKL